MSYERGWRGGISERDAEAGRHDDAQRRRIAPGKRTRAEIAYPHASAIQAALGVSLPGSAVHDAAACEARGVPAFTDGSVTSFASESPAPHVAAHEAAHQLQHAGLTRDAGLGAERHAHEVAEAITSGADARWLIGAHGTPVAPAVRNYTELTAAEQTARHQWMIGSTARVAETGRMVTSTSDRHLCYADPQLITDANQILRARRSQVQLGAGAAGPSGDAPDGSGHRTTVQVVTSVASQSGDDNYADCGRMSREVQGGEAPDSPARGVYRDRGGADRETPTGTHAPAQIRDEVLVGAGLGATPAAARAAYLAMTPAQRDAFDREHRLNRYAAPRVGESYLSARDDASTSAGFNFHWGGVIMVAEPDRVTLENFARPGTTYATQNPLWYFDMYGPPSRPGQTWHDRWAEGGGREGSGVGAPGHNTMTMTARTSVSTADLVRRYAASSDAGERTALEGEMRTRQVQVTVQVVRARYATDNVYVTAAHGGRRHQSPVVTMRTGDTHVFWLPLSALAPVSGAIVVDAYDLDLRTDNRIATLSFADPFTPASASTPHGGAEYRLTVQFDR